MAHVTFYHAAITISGKLYSIATKDEKFFRDTVRVWKERNPKRPVRCFAVITKL